VIAVLNCFKVNGTYTAPSASIHDNLVTPASPRGGNEVSSSILPTKDGTSILARADHSVCVLAFAGSRSASRGFWQPAFHSGWVRELTGTHNRNASLGVRIFLHTAGTTGANATTSLP
jgi:hypothetical protein